MFIFHSTLTNKRNLALTVNFDLNISWVTLCPLMGSNVVYF